MQELPLTEPTLFILISLAAGPRHGYAIMKDVQTLSEQRIVLSTGTLYGALKRLLEQDWIMRLGEGTDNNNKRVRKFYALTPTGQRILQAEFDRLQKLLGLVRRHHKPVITTANGQE